MSHFAVALGMGAELTRLGKEDKFRVLVDKVLMKAGHDHSSKWVMTEDHVKEIRDAGFNVVCPRIGGESMSEVRRISKLARKHGIFHIAWMRGTRECSPEEGPKYTHPDGFSQPLYSPNSDQLWRWMTKLILGHAKISTEVPSLIGTFLDFENYAPGSIRADGVWRGHCYGLSYDAKIVKEFAAHKGIEQPTLAPKDREPWLAKKGLSKEFREFQIRSWRTRCRELRREIDKINPKFLLVVYPVPGTLFITEAAYREWATEQAPVIVADQRTYKRPAIFLPIKEGLWINRARLSANAARIRKLKIPFMHIGGIDPISRTTTPEFCGKNAVMIAEATNGYWVFYEGPDYHRDHPDYFAWFKKANMDIVAGKFDLQHEPLSSGETMGMTKVRRKTNKLQIGIWGMKDRMFDSIENTGKFEVHPLNGLSLKYLKQLDVVVLQNANFLKHRRQELPVTHEISRNLRDYVEQGGGLLISHKTGWCMESMFPEIAVRDLPKHNKVEAGRYVVDTKLVVAKAHSAVGNLEPGLKFTTGSRDHMIFKPGAKGVVVIRNEFKDPVYVIGSCKKGRVVYSGCYYGYHKNLVGSERTVFFSVLDWLAGRAK